MVKNEKQLTFRFSLRSFHLEQKQISSTTQGRAALQSFQHNFFSGNTRSFVQKRKLAAGLDSCLMFQNISDPHLEN